MTLHNHISFYLLLILFIHPFFEVDAFTPLGRVGHSSVFVDNKLYFFGGFTGNWTNEVFYLDVSSQFSVGSPTFVDVTEKQGIPFNSSWETALLRDLNNDRIVFVFGAYAIDNSTAFDISTLDLKSGNRNKPVVNGKIPERRMFIQGVIDDSGKIYIFGGLGFNDDSLLYNDMIILDTNDLSWSYGSQFNALSKRAAYTATLLSNGKIAYIGGREIINGNRLGEADIHQINLYDAKLDTWSVMQARSNDSIEPRYLHSAVLTPEGRIIIYGGGKTTNKEFRRVTPDLAVLDTQTFEWIIPEVSSNVGEIPLLVSHTANLVENYMIVAFGCLSGSSFENVTFNSKIYSMDVRNYTWVDRLELEKVPTPSSSTTTATPSALATLKHNRHTIKIVIGTMSGIIALMTIGMIGFKWNQKKRKQKEIMRISGNFSSEVI